MTSYTARPLLNPTTQRREVGLFSGTMQVPFGYLGVRADCRWTFYSDDEELVGGIAPQLVDAQKDGPILLVDVLAIIRLAMDAYYEMMRRECEAEMATERAGLAALENYLPHWLDTQREDMMGLT